MNRSEKTTTSNETKNLTIDSPHCQYFTGTLDHTVVLPDLSSFTLGQNFTIFNNSTGIITLRDVSLNEVALIREGSMFVVSSDSGQFTRNITTDSTDSIFSSFCPDQISIDNSWNDITWSESLLSDVNFTHADGAPDVTINRKGEYSIQVDISSQITSGNTRSQVEVRILNNNVFIPGTKGLIYNRTSGFGGSVVIRISKNFAAGDTIKVQCIRQTGNSTIKTYPDGCRLNIQKINR